MNAVSDSFSLVWVDFLSQDSQGLGEGQGKYSLQCPHSWCKINVFLKVLSAWLVSGFVRQSLHSFVPFLSNFLFNLSPAWCWAGQASPLHASKTVHTVLYCYGCNKSAGCFAACSSPFWVAQGRLNYFNCSYPVTIQEAVPCVQAAVELRSALTAMKTENLILS